MIIKLHIKINTRQWRKLCDYYNLDDNVPVEDLATELQRDTDAFIKEVTKN